MSVSTFKFPDEIKRAINGLDNEHRLKIVGSLLETKRMSYSKLKDMLQLRDDEKGILNFHLKKLSESALIDRYEDWRKGNEERSFYKLSSYGKDLIDALLSSLEPRKELPKDLTTKQLNSIIWASPISKSNLYLTMREILEEWNQIEPLKLDPQKRTELKELKAVTLSNAT